MKIIVIILLFIINYSLLSGQAFQKGNFDCKAGIGTGIYSAVTNDPADSADNTVMFLIQYPVQIQYSFANRWSGGLRYERNHIVTNQQKDRVYANLNHYGLVFQYRLINKQDDNLNIHASFGSTGFKWNEKEKKDKLTGTGDYFDLGFSYHHYYTNVSGIYFSVSIPNINLKTIKNTFDQIVTYDYGSDLLSIRLSGFSIGAGYCLKF